MKLNILSRFVYVGFYAILNIILAVLLLITPGDAIRQALDNKQLYNVFVIAGSYFLTLILAIIIYISRLFADSATLKAIPKTWIPIENGDVNRKVRRMIVAGLYRSAVIAWNSRPRMPQELDVVSLEPRNRALFSSSDRQVEPNSNQKPQRHRSDSRKSDQVIVNMPSHHVWGEISHNGWSSPLSSDFPNLQYITVILELPLLIEAKAVSLTSSNLDKSLSSHSTHDRAVQILLRPAAMSLRDYIGYLTSLGVISTSIEAMKFSSLYEYSRFSEKPITEEQFKELMQYFTEILLGMKSLDSEMLSNDDESIETDTHPKIHQQHTHGSLCSLGSKSESGSGSNGTICRNN